MLSVNKSVTAKISNTVPKNHAKEISSALFFVTSGANAFLLNLLSILYLCLTFFSHCHADDKASSKGSSAFQPSTSLALEVSA